jgi:hypothetical protein
MKRVKEILIELSEITGIFLYPWNCSKGIRPAESCQRESAVSAGFHFIETTIL